MGGKLNGIYYFNLFDLGINSKSIYILLNGGKKNMIQINNDEMILNIVYYNDYDETEKFFDMFIVNSNELNKILLCDNDNELTETINDLTELTQTIYNVDLIYCHNGNTNVKNLYNQKYHNI